MCILQLHGQGLSLQAISEVLNREGVLTPAGRPLWSKSSVDRLLHTRYVQEIATRQK
jgi:Recombinase